MLLLGLLLVSCLFRVECWIRMGDHPGRLAEEGGQSLDGSSRSMPAGRSSGCWAMKVGWAPFCWLSVTLPLVLLI